jgi:hypothetical protein
MGQELAPSRELSEASATGALCAVAPASTAPDAVVLSSVLLEQAQALAPPTPFQGSLGAIAIPVPREKGAERRARRRATLQRALEILPGATALAVITFLAWGSVWAPLALAGVLLAFDLYWVWRSFNTAFHAVKGFFLLRREAKVDWRQRYGEDAARGQTFLAWEDVRHVVIIPNYEESLDKLRPTLDSLAAQQEAQRLIVVLAMEEAEPAARDKATTLCREYASRFEQVLATFHPGDLPGEVRGKSSNEAWAAREARQHLVNQMGLHLEHLTVTSCDADTIFHPSYFSCLTYKFATDRYRYRRFWQAPIFLYNNIWHVPAPLRLPNGLAGLNHLARLCRKHRMVFPQSCYSLSLQMAEEVGYWDVDVVPEDWHMFLKCFFNLGGNVDVEPIYLPLGNDGPRSKGYFRTFSNHYQQARRHAWGATDIPYAILQLLDQKKISLLRRLRRTWSVFESHLLWSTQWFIITVGRLVPSLVGVFVGAEAMPKWFNPMSEKILFPCIVPLIVLIVLDTLMRPKRPGAFRWWLLPVQYAQWFLLAPITFLFITLPALDAQMRLMLGKRLEYRVTEKA